MGATAQARLLTSHNHWFFEWKLELCLEKEFQHSFCQSTKIRDPSTKGSCSGFYEFIKHEQKYVKNVSNRIHDQHKQINCTLCCTLKAKVSKQLKHFRMLFSSLSRALNKSQSIWSNVTSLMHGHAWTVILGMLRLNCLHGFHSYMHAIPCCLSQNHCY